MDIMRVISTNIIFTTKYYLMSHTGFNLTDLQEAVVGVPTDLILPEEDQSKERKMKQNTIRKIVDMYTTCRSNGRIYKATYDALKDDNPFVRSAAADLISESGTQNSFEYLFEALEDEQNNRVKREIALAIDRLEAKVHDEDYDDEETSVSFVASMKLLSQA